ncbi:MAG: copper amine oxidase [Pseudoclavibacter sp.]
MRKSRLAIAGVLAVVVAMTGCGGPDADESGDGSAAVPEADCSTGEPVAQAFDNGAAWSMCWSVHEDLGLVLSSISYTPPGRDAIPVIESMTIAQLEVPYDHGDRTTEDITEAGFGAGHMLTLTETQCPGERHGTEIPYVGDGSSGASPSREVLCSESVDAGIAYTSNDTGQTVAARRTEWHLSSISKVGWYEYVSLYAFGDDGSIHPSLGATGNVSPEDYGNEQHGWPIGEGDTEHAASHSHNAVWRVHWALGGASAAVQQYDATDTGEFGTESPIIDGSLTDLEHPTIAEWIDRRWWRVLAPDVLNADGHPISYQIDVNGGDSFTFTADAHDHGDDAGYDIAFTNADDCQLFATSNPGDCGSSVLDYVADSESDALDDVVSWVAVGFHHVVRDEEQGPMEAHWQGFTMTPRDLTATRPDPPVGYEDLNGRPDEDWPL